MGFVYFIFLIFGTIVFLYSIIEAIIYYSLYGDRGVMCPEKFIQKEKATDIVSVAHHIYFTFFAVSCSVFGLNTITSIDHKLMLDVVTVSCVLSLVDMVLIWYMEKKNDLHKTLLEIKKQWASEKKISDIHNHEVNMYRDIKAFEKYKKQSIFSLVVNIIVVALATFLI